MQRSSLLGQSHLIGFFSSAKIAISCIHLLIMSLLQNSSVSRQSTFWIVQLPLEKIHDDCIYIAIHHYFLEVLTSHRIHREFLAEISCIHPRVVLTDESHMIVLSWLPKRYSRPAFPDTFNDYIVKINQIDTKLKTLDALYPFLKRLFSLVEPDCEIAPINNTSLKCRIASEIQKISHR